MLARVGVLEVEQVVVQVCHGGRAPARGERVNGEELTESQGRGKGPEVCGAMPRDGMGSRCVPITLVDERISRPAGA